MEFRIRNDFFSIRYYVKIFLDDDIYGKTTSKERREILFWGENFTFKDIPEGQFILSLTFFEHSLVFRL